MAAIALVFGGIFGLFSGMIALALGAGFLLALGLWICTGFGCALALVLLTRLPRPAPVELQV